MARIADLLAAGRTFSFEFSPPKTDAAQMSLGRTIAELEPLDPSFVSVTYGAGGSTRARTQQVVTWIGKETGITPMAHLTCQSHLRPEIRSLLDEYRAAGIENILALGGDPPKDPADVKPSDYTYASELLDQLDGYGFSVGVAAHPEVHPRSADRAATAGGWPTSCAAPTSPSPSSSSSPSTTCASSTSWPSSGWTSRCCPGSCRSPTSASCNGWPS